MLPKIKGAQPLIFFHNFQKDIFNLNRITTTLFESWNTENAREMQDNSSTYKLGKELSEQDLMILEAVQRVWQDGSVGKVITVKSWLPEFNPFNPCHEYMSRHTERQPCFRQGCPEYAKTVIIKNDQSIRGLMKSTVLSIRNRNWQRSLKSPQQLPSVRER